MDIHIGSPLFQILAYLITKGRKLSMSEYAIEMLHITKRFPGIIANDDISLQLRKGEIVRLHGAFRALAHGEIDMLDERAERTRSSFHGAVASFSFGNGHGGVYHIERMLSIAGD